MQYSVGSLPAGQTGNKQFNSQSTINSINQSNAELYSVQLKVYDILGKEVATLVNEQQRPGQYEVKWDASGLASGMYFYKLTAGKFTETKKMILLR